VASAFLSITQIEARNMTRDVIDLSSDWQFAPINEPDLTYPPPGDLTWYPTDALLFPRRGNGAYGLWYTRSFDVPASFGSGKHLKLEFGGAKYTATVYVNGEQVGSYDSGFVPFNFDVTEHINPGQPNEIFVAVGGVPFTMKRQVPNPPRDLDSLRALGPLGLVPLGLLAHEVGLWDGVSLVAYNPVYISDTFVSTSFRNKQIVAQLRVSNDSDIPRQVSVSATVLDGSVEVLDLPSKTIQVGPGASSSLVLKSKWPDPKLWSPDSPHLYDLRIELNDPNTLIDSHTQRFGFREFWTDGPDFRLNGIRIKLRGAGTHFFSFRERGWDTKEGAMRLLETLKEKNFNIIRFHAQIWPAHMYEAADEVGFLTVPESPMWTRIVHYADIHDPRFWENAKAQLQGMVIRDRNHPSVAFWSIENEFLHMVGRDEEQFRTIEREIAKLGRFVKTLDPTRPIIYAADLDPEGTADVIGLHYVVEYPNFNLVPDEFYWLNKPIERSPGQGLGLLHPEPWMWDRKKPFFITEFA
jgi:beta-galactosidase/beta-glucuronidase